MSSKLRQGAYGAALILLAACSGPAPAAPEPTPLPAGMRTYYIARLADNDASRFGQLPASPMPNPPRDTLLDALVTWDRLRRDTAPADFTEIAGFLRVYPGWPAEIALRRHAEKLIDANSPTAAILGYFAAFPPLTATAKLRLAEAQLATGNSTDALRNARAAWASAGLDAAAEPALQARFGGLLTPDDHLARLDALLWSGQATAASRLLGLIPADRQPWAAARLAFRTGAPDADARWAALTPADRTEPGIVLDRALWLQRAGDVAGMRSLLAGYSGAAGQVVDPETWLKNRLAIARATLRDGQFDLAYRVAANHRAFALGRGLAEHSLAERQLYIDTEWTAGWLALRKLARPADALVHFGNVRAAAQSPVSQSRGDYWSGRAAEAAGQTADAHDYYTAAAAHPDYYYGQLAAEKLDGVTLPAAVAVKPSGDARREFDANALVRLARALGDMGDRTRQTLFLKTLADRADTAVQQRLLGDFANELGRPDLGVYVGKAARGSELTMPDIAYPQLSLPAMLDGSWTMIHAISRQESQFDRAVVSRANARGLMQLLPGTAADTAAKLGLPASTARLTDDPVYNVTLGSAYYARIRDNLGGSHVLAVAAYNAGPGNVRKWLAANGDPRDAGVDVIDWVEAIPFSETRDYVQRVLANAVVYDLLHPATATMPGRKRLSGYLGR